jgi:hypothetical protein
MTWSSHPAEDQALYDDPLAISECSLPFLRRDIFSLQLLVRFQAERLVYPSCSLRLCLPPAPRKRNFIIMLSDLGSIARSGTVRHDGIPESKTQRPISSNWLDPRFLDVSVPFSMPQSPWHPSSKMLAAVPLDHTRVQPQIKVDVDGDVAPARAPRNPFQSRLLPNQLRNPAPSSLSQRNRHTCLILIQR